MTEKHHDASTSSAQGPEDILVLMGGSTGGRNSAIIDTTRFQIRTRQIEVPTV